MSQGVATQSLFDRIGGQTAVETVVDEFYKRVLADNELGHFFSGTDMDKQRQHQVNFITMALGGPNQYSGRSMKKSHETFSITENHFNLVAGHLVETLKWAGVGQSEIDEVVDKVSPLKGDIVSA